LAAPAGRCQQAQVGKDACAPPSESSASALADDTLMANDA